MTASAGAWYRVGDVNVTNGSQSVVGVGTNWQNDVISIAIGDAFTVDATTWYEVIAVNSDTSITLDRGFEGGTQNSAKYAIMRGTSGTILTRIAGQVAVQFNQKQLFLDELRTWLNSDNTTEELTDSHGLKQSLKTPSQMARDHAEKLAQLNEIHPFPWAMRKVEFEARRQQNLEEYAASGFVHFGKHFNSGFVNEGLTTLTDVWSEPKINRFWLGRNPSSTNTQGKSTSHSAIISIAGVLTDLESIGDDYNAASRLTTVKLPPAEDGTRTYDSATGVSVTHATPALAFAAETATNKVVTDRVDMWGFEGYLREINDSDPFVYANGLIQSRATSINGVAATDDNVRPITYFAWYEGDDSSRGRGVNWQTATEAQRMAIASDPANNIFFDDATGKFYQWCVRGRSFAGLGNGDWSSIDSGINSIDSLHILGFNLGKTSNRVKVQGILDAPSDIQGSHFFSQTMGSWAADKAQKGVFTVRQDTSSALSVDGECYFLVCGTVNRLNQGAYHPTFNPSGSCEFVDSQGSSTPKWHLSDKKPSSKLDCFVAWNGSSGAQSDGFVAIHNTGYIGSVSGRPDGRFYDAVYSSGQGGVCRDMRYSAHGLSLEDFAEHDLKIKSGEYRGVEKIEKTNIYIEKASTNNTGSLAVQATASTMDRYSVGDRVYLVDSTLNEVVLDATITYKGPDFFNTDTLTSYNRVAGRDYYVIITTRTTFSVAGEHMHTDVIGDPANILLCDDLKDGWIGDWIPFMPDGSPTKVAWSRPYLASGSLSAHVTDDNGATWQSGTTSIWFGDAVRNESSQLTISSNRVVVASYTAKANMTKQAANVAPYKLKLGLVDLLGDKFDGVEHLVFSLSGDILNVREWLASIQNIPLQGLRHEDDGKLNPSGFAVSHTPLSQHLQKADYPCLKVFSYLTESNGQCFINYAYRQLKFDAVANDFGDDAKVPMVSNQSTMLDDNGNTVKLGTAQVVEPLGWIKRAS